MCHFRLGFFKLNRLSFYGDIPSVLIVVVFDDVSLFNLYFNTTACTRLHYNLASVMGTAEGGK